MKKLLILDIDETLIHASERPLDRGADFRVGQYYVYQRPYVQQFMGFCREHFHVAAWTTATPDYAALVLVHICSEDYPFEFVWCRERCTFKGEGFDGSYRWLKDLKKVRKLGWSLEHVLMLEDQPANLSRHYGNVIRIDPFDGNPEDMELKRLMPFLLELKSVENVRVVEKRGWKSRFNV